MQHQAEIVVIGAGVVGLACAAALAQQGHQVTVLERHAGIGQETSSRNSEVIHAGLYYPHLSLKALCCVEGRDLLYAYCQARVIPHRRIGKIIVATDPKQLRDLEALQARGIENRAGALRMLEPSELRRLEPHVQASHGLLSPDTGIIDSHGFLESLKRDALDAGAIFAFHTRVVALERGARWSVHTLDDRGETTDIETDWVINAAGLEADRIAQHCGIDLSTRTLRLYPCKGDYFTLSSRLRGIVNHLVYPLPVQAGLGIHITMDLGGQLRAGPDTEYVAAPRYDIDASKAALFAAAVQRYLPTVRDEDLLPGYAGVRPKLAGPGVPFRDFVCEVFEEAPRAMQLVGIESPGLTAALSLARRVVARVGMD